MKKTNLYLGDLSGLFFFFLLVKPYLVTVATIGDSKDTCDSSLTDYNVTLRVVQYFDPE